MKKTTTRRAVAMAGCIALLLIAGAAQARDIKRCGITIGAGKTGKLVKDVFCRQRCVSDPQVECDSPEGRTHICPVGDDPACEPATITLERNATLDLNGFNLVPAFEQDGVICSPGSKSRCTIKGPGRIMSNRGTAIIPNDRDVVLKDLTIFGDRGGFTTTGRLFASNVAFDRCEAPMSAGSGIRLKLVGVDDGCMLSTPENVVVDYVYLSGSIEAGRTVRGRRVRNVGTNAELTGKDVFLNASSVKRVRAARRLVLRDTYAQQIASGDRPSLIRSECMESEIIDAGATWGVCELD